MLVVLLLNAVVLVVVPLLNLVVLCDVVLLVAGMLVITVLVILGVLLVMQPVVLVPVVGDLSHVTHRDAPATPRGVGQSPVCLGPVARGSRP